MVACTVRGLQRARRVGAAVTAGQISGMVPAVRTAENDNSGRVQQGASCLLRLRTDLQPDTREL